MILAFNCYVVRPGLTAFDLKKKGKESLCVFVVSQTHHLSSELCDMMCTVLVILIVIDRQLLKCAVVVFGPVNQHSCTL